MNTIAENVLAVRDRYASKLAEVQAQIAADAAANPKAAPNMSLTEARWRLQGRVRLANELASLFAEEGL